MSGFSQPVKCGEKRRKIQFKQTICRATKHQHPTTDGDIPDTPRAPVKGTATASRHPGIGVCRYPGSCGAFGWEVQVKSAALGPNHPSIASPLGSLGLAHLATGHPQEARAPYQRSVAVRTEALGDDRPDLILFGSLIGLGRAEVELGNSIAAEQSLERALSFWHQEPDSMNSRFGPGLWYLGQWLVERRRCAEAVPLLLRVTKFPLTHPHPLSAQLEDPETLLARCSAAPPDSP